MSQFINDEFGIQGIGVLTDPTTGNTVLNSQGPSGIVSVEDQNEYWYAFFNPNDGNASIRSGQTLSGIMSMESVSGNLYLGDKVFKNLPLTSPGAFDFVSGFFNRSIIGAFNSLPVTVKQNGVVRSPFVTGVNFTGTVSVSGSGKDLNVAIGNSAITMKTGNVSGVSFSGNPKKYTVVFTSNFPDLNYGITFGSGADRNFTYESQATSGFVINSNANTAFTQLVSWSCLTVGEF